MKSSAWPKRKLGDLIETISDTFRFDDQEVVFLNTSDVYDGRVLQHSFSQPHGLPGQAKKRIRRGDLLFSEIRPANRRFALIDFDADRYVVSTKLMVLRSKGEISPEYLRLVLTSQQTLDYLQRIAESRSGTFPQITFDQVADIEIPLPTPEEQADVSGIVGAINEKIELNRQTCLTLEATARATFKSWFVDFDPVRAKSSGRTPELMSPDLALLFPNKLVENQEGEFPANWTQRAIYDCAEYINGAAFKSHQFCDPSAGKPVIKIGELKDGITNQTKFTDSALDSKYDVQSGDILFSWSGSPDTSIDIFIWTGPDGWLNQHIFKIEFHRPVEKCFVFYLLRHLKPVFVEIARNKQTTGLGHVTAQDLKRLRTAFPPDEILNAFNTIAEPILLKTYLLAKESQALARLRDTLLPKLLSGELRVPDVKPNGKEAVR